MRTTLEIDDDVLQAAKDLARQQNKTAGQVVSELSRRALVGGAAGPAESARGKRRASGFRAFPSRGSLVTNAAINKLRDDSVS